MNDVKSIALVLDEQERLDLIDALVEAGESLAYHRDSESDWTNEDREEIANKLNSWAHLLERLGGEVPL